MTTPRQLVLLCDGTNNNLSGRRADTHVVLLAELLQRFPDPQRLVYYDPGVGNPGQLPGTTVVDKAGRALDRINGLAFGRGLYDNVAEGYHFLMAHWQPGDEIYVLGFSRGAFTARSIAGMVNAFGIINGHQDTLVGSLVATYFSAPSDEQKAIVDQASRLFGQGLTPDRRPVVHFVGVWDTVASVGLPPFGLKIAARPTLAGKRFRHVRHALALDEQRAQFSPRAYAQDDGPYTLADDQPGDIVQCWFRGAHCDVGGGNDHEASELSRTPFAWLVAEAIGCGLRLPAPSDLASPKTEADLLALLPLLDPPGVPREPASVSSQTAESAVWALTGLAVRDTNHVAVAGAAPAPVRTCTHPSVGQWDARFPRDTVWAKPLGRAFLGWQAGQLLGVLLLMLGTGALLHPDARDALALLCANVRFQHWQLDLFASTTDWRNAAASFAHPGLALTLDLALIGLYAVLLAPWVCRAFARHAGLIHVGHRPARLLNLLGWALPAAVGADLAENLLSALALWAAGAWGSDLLTWAPRLALFVASAGKCVALAGVAGLIGSAWLRRHRR
ncbi:T6SS phospholipase effector Tle1-like catalytic domain-containing protein [Leptothrix sp. BB-4]